MLVNHNLRNLKMNAYLKFGDLKGKVLAKVENLDDKELVFTTTNGEVYKLYHIQECCESVTIEDICGNLSDLIGEPLLVAEEVKHRPDVNPDGVPAQGYQESFIWTFYKLDTRKGGVTVRWYGESNGFYSESVDFCRVA